jgi:hypothetical protein
MVAARKCGNPEKFIEFYPISNCVMKIMKYVSSYTLGTTLHIKNSKNRQFSP